MDQQTNTGYGTQHERMREVSMELPFAMPKSGSVIMDKPKLIKSLGFTYWGRHKCEYGLYECSCGKEFRTQVKRVDSGYTKSCGCYRIAVTKERMTTHGLRGHRLYNVWHNILRRCYDEENQAYERYGARGINVYGKWVDDFKAFYDYVTKLPNYGKHGMTLDREDNDGNYEPNNLRWVDRHTQTTNTRIRKANKSGYTGVFKTRNRYRSLIRVKGIGYHLGYFDSARKAVDARNEFIVLNKLIEYKIQ